MTAKSTLMEEFSFGGEALGSAAGMALRKVRSLSEQAPIGRLFDSISTLAELTTAAAQELERANTALARHDISAAREAMAKATMIGETLRNSGTGASPSFLRRKA
jgi:hypothetical protein